LFYEALKHVDVFSPNTHELSLLFQDQQGIRVTPEYDQELVGSGLNTTWSHALAVLKSTEGQCRQLQAKGFEDPNKALVARLGEKGCAVLVHGATKLLPAYHAPRHELSYTEKRLRKNKVVDVTGGGNAFLGGFCAGLAQGISEHLSVPLLFEIAAAYGGVAASFAIEQVGLPKLTPRKADGAERWNGSLPFERVRTMGENAHPTKSVAEDRMSFLFEWIRSLEIDNV
jgi:sugar/nucleoside kinase (ribokinase family)